MTTEKKTMQCDEDPPNPGYVRDRRFRSGLRRSKMMTEIPGEPTSEQIRTARLMARLTLEEAASLVYRTKRNWSQWEKGTRQMDAALWEFFKIQLERQEGNIMARYSDAIRWIVENDDTNWLEDSNGTESVAAALVADLFYKTDGQVKTDLIKETQRIEKQKENITKKLAIV